MSLRYEPQLIKNEIKETLSIGLPLISAQVIYACSGFVGTAMVSRLGVDALAASVLVSMTWVTLTTLFFGILNAVSVLVSHQYGARNYARIGDIMGQATLLGIMIMVLMALILFTVPWFLHFSDQPPRVILLAREYVHSLLWTIPSLVLLVIYEQFLAGVNRARIVLRISLMVVPIEIPIIYILIFGKFGLPACGVAGVGYGFATTYFITCVGLLTYLAKSKHYAAFNLFQKVDRRYLQDLAELIRVGWPMGLMHLIEVGAFMVATIWIAHFSTTLLAAHQIVLQFLSFVITVIFSMSQAVTVRVGHEVGSKNLLKVRYASFIGMSLSFLCMLLVAILFNCFPDTLLYIDFDITNPKNSELLHFADKLLGIGGILLLFDNFRITGFGALRGLKDTRFPMLASFIAFWVVGLSTAYYLGFHRHLGGTGIWWGLTIGIASGAVIMIARLQYMLQRVDLNEIMKTNNTNS